VKRLAKLPPWQSVGLIAAIVFAVYLAIAITVQARGGSQNSMSGIAGAGAYIVLFAALILYGNAWRRRPNAPERLVIGYLQRNRTVTDRLGQPVTVDVAERIGRAAVTDGVQMPVIANIRGPLGTAEAHLTLARVSGSWEILHAELDRDGATIPLATGQ
jgi:hypothetical protein